MSRVRACNQSLSGALEFIAWCIDRGIKDGRAIQYAKECGLYADEWAMRK